MRQNSEDINIAVLGLGNELLSDDGIGVHAIRLLQRSPIASVIMAEIGTAALKAQQILIESDHVIAIDAVHHDGLPGTIYTFDVEGEQKDQVISLHDLGIIGAVKLLEEHLRPKVHIVGVEPEKIEYDMELSETVKTSLPKAVETVKQIVMKLKAEKLHKTITNQQS